MADYPRRLSIAKIIKHRIIGSLLNEKLERMSKKTAPGLLQSKKFVFYYVFNTGLFIDAFN